MKRTVLVFFILLHAGIAFGQDGKDFFSNPPQASLGVGKSAAEARIEPGRVQLSGAEIDALILPRGRAAMNFPSIDRFTGNEANPLLFRPLKLFAAGARVHVIADNQAFEQAIGERQYYIANNRSTGIGLAVDPQSGEVSGFAVKGGERLQIEGDFVSQLDFVPIEEPPDGSIACGNGEHDLSLGAPAVEAGPSAHSASASAAGEAISYQAVVAVDTDSEWLDGFGDNTVAAMNWITDLFLAMNVFYERDVETRLLIGDVILRTSSDPYSPNSDSFAMLNEFGEYWMDNMDHVDRQFAAMFSGRSISQRGFSGMAWIDKYCDYGRSWGSSVSGSYSYNAIGSALPAAAAAHYVGHELGHNMGSPHTHCYSQPVDQCHSGETYGGNSCYSGPTACPADGSGTVMSYCHGLAGCHSDTEFHPTVQSRLENLLATELVAGCILPYADAAPTPQFVSDPAAGALINFGSLVIGSDSPNAPIQVQNSGAGALTLACSMSGPGAAQFTIQACVPSIDAGQVGAVQVNCSPTALGAHQATLTLLTNDADDTSVAFNLACTGVSAPANDLIFQGSFEVEAYGSPVLESASGGLSDNGR